MTYTTIFFVIALLSSFVEGKHCPSAVESFVASFEVKTLLSPGFPQPYETNEECTWGIDAAAAGYVIQLAAVEIDLSSSEGCANDFLEIYEGDNMNNVQKVVIWCGQEKQIFKTRRRYVQLKFVSDGHFAGRGFAIEYGLVKPADLSCRSGTPPSIEVGVVPVFDLFVGAEELASCTWKIQSALADTALVFEIYKPSDVHCKDGRFVFYEGDTSAGLTHFEYCSNAKAFSKMFFSTATVTLVFEHFEREVLDGLILKMYTRPVSYNCLESAPAIEVGDSPVFFSMPFNQNSGSNRCPVSLQTKSKETHLRLDVMGVDENLASCDTEAVRVSDTHFVTRACNRLQNPVYRGLARMTVLPLITNKIFLRAAAVLSECNGRQTEFEAYRDIIVERTLPDNKDYINLSQCKIKLSANLNDLIQLSIKWSLPSLESNSWAPKHNDTCAGDYINVYDGQMERIDDLLYSSCTRDSRMMVDVDLVSRANNLYIVLDTDAKIEGDSVTLEYHAVPRGDFCSTRDVISVNRTKQFIKSPNYPRAMPFKQNCMYDLTAETEDDVIVVNIVESNMAEDCDTMLTIYRGDFAGGTEDSPVVARVCGQDSGTYKIAKGRAFLHAKSGEHKGPGGWMVEVYTEDVADSGADINTATRLLLWLAVLALSLNCNRIH